MINGILKGVKAALTDGEPGDYLDMSRAGFPKSLYALLVAGLSLIGSVYVAYGGSPSVSSAVFIIAIILFLLTAPMVIYLICHLISRSDLFKSWVIARNWTMLILAVPVLGLAGLGAAQILSKEIVLTAVMLLYIATLLIDIRLAQTMAKMNWTPAIFVACAVSVSAMLVLLAVFAAAAGY